MAQRKKPSIRQRAFHVVVVLLVFYPLVIYLYTYSHNRTSIEQLILNSVSDEAGFVADLAGSVEQVPLDRDQLKRFLNIRQNQTPFVRFLDVQRDGVSIDPSKIANESDPSQIDEIRFETRPARDIVQQRLGACAIERPNKTLWKVTIPVMVERKQPAYLIIHLVPPPVGEQLAQIAQRLSMRALRLSLMGTSMLALLAAYIVYLNDRTQELETRLQEEKRLAYVGTIAAGMAHEIRNPLSNVKMNIQMIEARLNEFGEQEVNYLATKVARIHRETERLEESVNNFLSFARPKPLQRRYSNLNESIDHVVEFLEPACTAEGIVLTRSYAPDLPQAYIDPDQLGQAIENLARNAMQAVDKPEKKITIETGRRDQYLEIRVTDNGHGVPPDVRDRIFDIFFTTKEAGTGLGLTIVKQIVEAHGGTITFQTTQGQGTTFLIRLPAD